MIYHSILDLTKLLTHEETYAEQSISKLKIVINTYLLIVIVFHCPVVFLQGYSQMKKLCRQNPIPDPNANDENQSVRGSFATGSGSMISKGTHFDA